MNKLYYFSKKTNGFYIFNDPLEYPKLPDDLVEITEQHWQDMLNGQSEGKVIRSDKKGEPTLTDPPPPTLEQILSGNIAYRDSLLVAANIRIAPLQYASDLEDAKDEELVLLKKWKEYSVALNRLDMTTKSVDWPATPE